MVADRPPNPNEIMGSSRLSLSLAAAVSLGVFLTEPAPRASQAADRTAALRSLIEAERAFARAARAHGIRESFLANVADDGVLFRPRAVKGKKWLQDHQSPPSDSALLSWDPRWVDVSRAGDMGLSTGPYELRAKGPSDTVSGRGHFVTIWRRQSDGNWKFEVDIGVAGLPSPQMGDSVKPATAAPALRTGNVANDKLRAELLLLDQQLGATRSDPVSTLLPHMGAESWIFRRRRAPVMGASAVRAALSQNPGTLASKPEGSGVARSGDVGYTYGSYDFTSAGSDRGLDETGNYMRVWKLGPGSRWVLVLDILSPAPPAPAPSPSP